MKENDDYIEIWAVRCGGLFLGFLSAYLLQQGKSPSAKEFAPIYLGAGMLFLAFMRGGFKTSEVRSFGSKYPISFAAHIFMIVASFAFFVLGQFVFFIDRPLPSFLSPTIKHSDIAVASASFAWVWVHFSANCLYNDLLKSFSKKAIDKYVMAPVDGWAMGLSFYHIAIRLMT